MRLPPVLRRYNTRCACERRTSEPIEQDDNVRSTLAPRPCVAPPQYLKYPLLHCMLRKRDHRLVLLQARLCALLCLVAFPTDPSDKIVALAKDLPFYFLAPTFDASSHLIVDPSSSPLLGSGGLVRSNFHSA